MFLKAIERLLHSKNPGVTNYMVNITTGMLQHVVAVYHQRCSVVISRVSSLNTLQTLKFHFFVIYVLSLPSVGKS